MCDFEDIPIISKYPLSQAIIDGVVVRIGNRIGKPIIATSHIREKLDVEDLLRIFDQFEEWDREVRFTLPREQQLFSTTYAERKVWVIEDPEAFTIMYPEDY